MKRLPFSCLLFISLFSKAQHVELPLAKFITGDNIAYSYPSWEDTKWMELKTNTSWDSQGFADYDGFAWYRFHLIIPKAYRANSLWKDSLRIFMAKVDDACEVYLNAIRIGKSGSFPDDKQGYVTTWDKKLEFHISADFPSLNWGGENILSVRVYDGGGAGGIFGGMPYVSMIDLIDGVEIDNAEPVHFINSTNAQKSITLKNTLKELITGKLTY
jgi:alpha-galactosidase